MPCNIVGKIVQSTVQECQETSAIWINHVLILLLTQYQIYGIFWMECLLTVCLINFPGT
jgi:hypothetical protein